MKGRYFMIGILKKNTLLIKIILAVVFGILVGLYLPSGIVILFTEVSGFLQKLISFFVPLIVIGFVVSGISSLKNSSGKLLAIALALSYSFMFIGAISSYFISKNIFPLFLGSQNIDFSGFDFKENPHFNISIPPLMDVMTAIILAFIIGIGISKIKGNILKNLFDEFHDIVELTVKKVMVPIIPFYIVGIFARMSSKGKIFEVLFNFSKFIGVIICIHILILIFQYIIAAIVTKKNFFKLIKNVIPAYITSLATQSSVAAIPFSIKCAENNGVSEKISNFILPLCSTIHLTGSAISITANVIAVMMMNGMEISFSKILSFIFLLGIIMVAAPGVPCGAIFAVFPILQSSLGFDQSMLGMIVALHIAQDGFGTACNVTGDGTIALIVEKINSKYFENNRRYVDDIPKNC